jgi:hypothetical protein
MRTGYAEHRQETAAQMRRGFAGHGWAANEMTQVIEIGGKKKPRFLLSVRCVCHEGLTQSIPKVLRQMAGHGNCGPAIWPLQVSPDCRERAGFSRESALPWMP